MTQETREPATPQTRSAKRHVVMGMGSVALALLLAALGVILMGGGQFYAIILLPLALGLAWWGKRQVRIKETEIR